MWVYFVSWYKCTYFHKQHIHEKNLITSHESRYFLLALGLMFYGSWGVGTTGSMVGTLSYLQSSSQGIFPNDDLKEPWCTVESPDHAAETSTPSS